MAKIPMFVNGVRVTFAPKARNEVDPRIVEALNLCIPKLGVPLRMPLREIWISSASDQHNWPSRHSDSLVVRSPMFKAIDISRINGVKIAVGYPSDPGLKAIVDSIQTRFESYAHRRENFGPLFKKKLGAPYSVSGHGDHIHLSVN